MLLTITFKVLAYCVLIVPPQKVLMSLFTFQITSCIRRCWTSTWAISGTRMPRVFPLSKAPVNLGTTSTAKLRDQLPETSSKTFTRGGKNRYKRDPNTTFLWYSNSMHRFMIQWCHDIDLPNIERVLIINLSKLT